MDDSRDAQPLSLPVAPLLDLGTPGAGLADGAGPFGIPSDMIELPRTCWIGLHDHEVRLHKDASPVKCSPCLQKLQKTFYSCSQCIPSYFCVPCALQHRLTEAPTFELRYGDCSSYDAFDLILILLLFLSSPPSLFSLRQTDSWCWCYSGTLPLSASLVPA